MCIVLEPLERLDRALPDDRSLTEEAHLGATSDDTIGDHTTGDGADAGNPEDLAHFGFAGDNFFVLRLEKTEHGILDVFEKLVDDLVVADLDLFLVGQLTSLAVGADVEPEDGRIGSRSQLHVVFGDSHQRRGEQTKV